MAKLTLNPSPTFKATVAIPVPGSPSVDVEFTFKHRGRTEFDAWRAGLKDMSNEAALVSIVDGWDLDDPCNADNLKVLSDTYMGAPIAVLSKYLDELTAARVKN